jgi:hypothetical protein
VIERNSVALLARDLNFSKSVLNSYVKNGRNTNYYNWQFRYKTEEPWKDPENKLAPRCIKATNVNSGETLTFNSLRECAKRLGVKDRDSIVLRIRNGQPYKNYLFKEIESALEETLE